MAITREEIVSELRRLVAANRGQIPGERTFGSATRIKESAWKGKYWVRFSDLVREAGYQPNTLNQKIPDEDILSKLAEFLTGQAHFPVRDEINVHARSTPGFPVWQTIKNRYGGMAEAAAALLEHSRQTGNAALARLCEERLQRESPKATPAEKVEQKTSAKPGYVYLKYSPSLRLYKIGKANDPDKRGAGISLLLPGDLVRRHEIKTDCPFILEKYWQNRFRTKKKQGEWYDLTPEDVEAFKRRRDFMFSEFFP